MYDLSNSNNSHDLEWPSKSFINCIFAWDLSYSCAADNKISSTRLSVILIVGPKCTLAASHAAILILFSFRTGNFCLYVFRPTLEGQRRTDGRTPDVSIHDALRAKRGQHNKLTQRVARSLCHSVLSHFTGICYLHQYNLVAFAQHITKYWAVKLNSNEIQKGYPLSVNSVWLLCI